MSNASWVIHFTNVPLCLCSEFLIAIIAAIVIAVVIVIVGLGLKKMLVVLSYQLSDSPTQGDQSADTATTFPCKFNIFHGAGKGKG